LVKRINQKPLDRREKIKSNPMLNLNSKRLTVAVLVTLLCLAPHQAGCRGQAQTDAKKEDSHKQLYTCGMHPQVVQDHPGTCPICHMKLVPMRDDSPPSETSSEKKIKYYWDPMLGPSSISDKPGKSAMGMDLVPVYEDSEANGPAVRIDPSVVQNMGVRTVEVTSAPLSKTFRAVGILTLPEPGLFDVSLKVSGWIEKLYADKEGMHIKKGEPLFEIYSPELQVAEEELLAAAKSGAGKDFFESAKKKLTFWDISADDIETLLKSSHAPRTTIIRSPATGHIEEKMVVAGTAVQPGMKLLRIADHSSIWLEAQVYAEDIPAIALNQEVEARVEGIPGEIFKGPITFVSPHLDPMTRTLKIRVTLTNPTFQLKPGMYGTAMVKSTGSAEVLLVPQEAVIDTGEKQIAFVALPEGHFEPRTVETGMSGDNDLIEIKSGLAEGEKVVTSGQFLLDVESRTTEAIQKLRAASSGPTTSAGE